MSTFLYTFLLQWKLDIRNKDILIIFYLVPIGFFLFIGGIFTSIMPETYQTLIASMTVFGISMGAVLGFPIPMVELLNSDIKKCYKVGNISLVVQWFASFLASFVHLFIVSMIILVLAPLVYDAVVPEKILTYLLKLSLFIFASLAAGSILGILVKNQSKLTMMGQVIFLPSIMLSGIMFSKDLLPSFLQGISKMFPATWGFELLSMNNINWFATGILIAFIILLSSITIWKLRKA